MYKTYHEFRPDNFNCCKLQRAPAGQKCRAAARHSVTCETPFCGAPVWLKKLNMPKSVSA